jgi:2,4-dienoyl-CoA reductase-like NADH-dependent reductase (Old Yellow Enzyme family)
MGEHPLVFQPLQIAGLVLRNRMVGLPIGLSGFIDGHGAPTERMIALYRRRAAGGAGLITVEIATVEPHTCPQVGLLRFDSDQHIPAFSLLVDAIHEAGAAAALQIGSALHVMLFLENLIRALLIFNRLQSRCCQRALLGYHYRSGGCSTPLIITRDRS